jgi:phosphatidylethanolamine/phosphatidyl-N-methylethanolamine N-methyltransferase
MIEPKIRTQKRATQLTRARYDRIAGIYDRLERPLETRCFQQWRTMLWERVQGPRVLEIGVGTGKNMPFYHKGWQITAIDLSPRMLEQAKRRAEREHVEVDLRLGDAQALPFADASFDTVIATFVFCSVPDPVQGLREAARVLVPGGQLLLLEHVLSKNVILRPLMQLANPLMVRMSGANMNRETVKNIERAGFAIQRVDDLWGDIVKFIEAEKLLLKPAG